jgi:hypothetical protein
MRPTRNRLTRYLIISSMHVARRLGGGLRPGARGPARSRFGHGGQAGRNRPAPGRSWEKRLVAQGSSSTSRRRRERARQGRPGGRRRRREASFQVRSSQASDRAGRTPTHPAEEAFGPVAMPRACGHRNKPLGSLRGLVGDRRPGEGARPRDPTLRRATRPFGGAASSRAGLPTGPPRQPKHIPNSS